MASAPGFSIITPSFNMLSYLKRCSASVADQEGVSREHIVVDGGSTDGTVDWLRQNPEIRSISEPDDGMYDAINKGLRMARGDVVAYLNCDEQYLPGTLAAVREHFRRHPEADVVFGDALLVDPQGNLVAYRKAHRLRWFYILSSYLYVLSCSTFIRRRVIEDGMSFSSDLQAVADADLIVRLLREGYNFSHLRRYLSVFTMTGRNKTVDPDSMREQAEFKRSAPIWVRHMTRPLNLCRLLERALNGVYFQRFPLRYAIHTEETASRTVFTAHEGSFRLPWTGPKLSSESTMPLEETGHRPGGAAE